MEQKSLCLFFHPYDHETGEVLCGLLHVSFVDFVARSVLSS